MILILDSLIDNKRITCFKLKIPKFMLELFIETRFNIIVSEPKDEIFFPNWNLNKDRSYSPQDIELFNNEWQKIIKINQKFKEFLMQYNISNDILSLPNEHLQYVNVLIQGNESDYNLFFGSGYKDIYKGFIESFREEYKKSIPVVRSSHLPFMDVNNDISEIVNTICSVLEEDKNIPKIEKKTVKILKFIVKQQNKDSGIAKISIGFYDKIINYFRRKYYEYKSNSRS